MVCALVQRPGRDASQHRLARVPHPPGDRQRRPAARPSEHAGHAVASGTEQEELELPGQHQLPDARQGGGGHRAAEPADRQDLVPGGQDVGCRLAPRLGRHQIPGLAPVRAGVAEDAALRAAQRGGAAAPAAPVVAAEAKHPRDVRGQVTVARGGSRGRVHLGSVVPRIEGGPRPRDWGRDHGGRAGQRAEDDQPGASRPRCLRGYQDGDGRDTRDDDRPLGHRKEPAV